MITNHYGVYVDSDIPTTGVLSVNQVNIESLMDSMYCQDGINISEEDRLDEFKAHLASYISPSDYSEEVKEELIDLLDEYDFIHFDRLSENAQDEILSLYFENDDSYPDDVYLIGQWVKDEDGLYIPDKSGDYSAIVRESTIQVVWSKYTIKVNNLCSPCYPGQADIHIDDNNKPIESKEDGYMTYNLPDEFFIYNER